MDERVRFFGCVDFGTDLTLDDLRPMYDMVVFATGAQSDRNLNIPGEDLARQHVRHRVRRLVQRPPRLS
jgi:ferredoxin/flavodoxin---NADP+ reductase